jgi:uncharacterized protein DUF3562
VPTTEPHQVANSAESAVATLALQTRTPPDEVRKVYEEERERLRRDAAVTQFIDVIASRRTKARLKKRRAQRPS